MWRLVFGLFEEIGLLGMGAADRVEWVVLRVNVGRMDL